MNKTQSLTQHNLNVHLAFKREKLEALIREGKLHAADFNCLDPDSKKTVWSMLLAAAARSMRF